MTTSESVEQATEILQQLGLKEYEARCFVGLSRLDTGTAKRLSELTEVPRTRVYDAIRVLEAQGLVEIQHSSPQQFRAVPLEEAAQTLRDRYDNRIDRLHGALDTIGTVETDDESTVQQVWALSGHEGIESRTEELIEDASEEVVLVLGEESLLTDGLVETLNGLGDGTELVIGALTESTEERIRESVPHATTFLSGLGWLRGGGDDETAIGRLLLVDRSAILVSSIIPGTKREQAVFGEGFGNGLVVVARRLMSQGLVTARDPKN